MHQGEFNNHIAITLHPLEDEMVCLTLSSGESKSSKLRLSLKEARKLASNLIQHVHSAEVRNSLKKNVLKAV